MLSPHAGNQAVSDRRVGSSNRARSHGAAAASRRGGRPTLAQAQEKEEIILRNAKSLLIEEGIEKFSIDKLARRARMGKPTIYSRFKKKEALFQALLIREARAHAVAVMEEPASADTEFSIPQLMAQTIAHLQSPRGHLISRLGEWLTYEADDKSYAIQDQLHHVFVFGWISVVRVSKQKGHTKVRSAKRAAELIVEGIMGHARIADWLSPFEPEDPATTLSWAEEYWGFVQKALR